MSIGPASGSSPGGLAGGDIVDPVATGREGLGGSFWSCHGTYKRRDMDHSQDVSM